MDCSRFSRPLGLALVYGVGAMIWIVASDLWLAVASAEQGWGQAAGSIAKGTFFVIVTALVFYWFACRIERAARAGEAELQVANKALQASAEHYRALFADSRAVMLLLDPDTARIIDANAAAVAYYGWPKEELVGRAITSINTAPAEVVTAGMGRAQAGSQQRFLYQHRLADGSVRDVEVTSGPVTLRGKVHLYSLIHDVTERLQAERELRDSVALKQAIWDCSSLGLVVYEAEGGQAVQVNEAAAKIVGTTVEELSRHNFRESATWQRYGLLEVCDRALTEGHSTDIQTQMVTRYGKSLWMGATFTPFSFHERPHVLVSLQDVSADEDTLARLKLLESALEASPDGFVITDTQGRVEWVNSAFTTMTGYTLAEMRGRNTRLLKSGRQDGAFYRHLWETITTGRQWSGELQNARKDGGVYWEYMTIAPVMSASGGIHHYVAVKKDITVQKDLEKQMARSQRLESIGLLAGGIAHDLNNVLAPILMAADLFKLKYPTPEDQRRFELIRTSAERGAKIVKQVLSFARGVDGQRVLLQPHHLIKELRHLLTETFPRGIEITVQARADGPSLMGDMTQLHQMLLNLAVNARDAMPDGGTLNMRLGEKIVTTERVTLSGLVIKAGRYVIFRVSDTGHGISAGHLERVFDPFFTTKAVGEGTGLGLSTVLGIVRGHGGGIEVSSTVGKGTEFHVFLPAVEPAAASLPPFAAAAPMDGTGRVVLLVDDEAPVREVTRLVLESRGFVVVEAVNGEEAIKQFEAAPARFDLVILDLIMPKVGGGKVAAAIKARRPELPIVLTSGVLSDGKSVGEDAVLYRQHGDVGLSKPFSQNELLDLLDKVLGGEKKKS